LFYALTPSPAADSITEAFIRYVVCD
jgi:hypothetical protein